MKKFFSVIKRFFNWLIRSIEISHQSRVEHYIRMMQPRNAAEADFYLQQFMRRSVSQR